MAEACSAFRLNERPLCGLYPMLQGVGDEGVADRDLLHEPGTACTKSRKIVQVQVVARRSRPKPTACAARRQLLANAVQHLRSRSWRCHARLRRKARCRSSNVVCAHGFGSRPWLLGVGVHEQARPARPKPCAARRSRAAIGRRLAGAATSDGRWLNWPSAVGDEGDLLRTHRALCTRRHEVVNGVALDVVFAVRPVCAASAAKSATSLSRMWRSIGPGMHR